MTIALGLPHTPWIPERARSYARLLSYLDIHEHDDQTDADGYGECSGTKPIDEGMCTGSSGPDHLGYFQDRESNKIWPRKMWGWGLETGASHFLTLQDDVLVSPDFWPALRAMLEAVPDQIISLAAVHPLGPEMARQGQRWYRTKSWVIGWGYLLPRADLTEFVAWVDAHPEAVARWNEDQMLNEWILMTGRETWHPVPSIADHDTSVESTYGNDDHTHRRTTVTWRGYPSADLTSADWWRVTPGPVLPLAWQRQCWSCGVNPIRIATKETGCGLCTHCIGAFVNAAIGQVPAQAVAR